MLCQHPLAARQKLHSYFFPMHTRKTYEISIFYRQIRLPLHICLDGGINQVWVTLGLVIFYWNKCMLIDLREEDVPLSALCLR